MKRCAFAFLKGKAVLSCLELCMAMAVLGQKDPSATAAVLQQNALHELTDQKSGLTVPIFHQLSVRSKAQPINLSGLADIQAYVHPTNKKDHGNRRMQSTCDTDKTALYSCFPGETDTCEGCYSDLISKALEQSKYCGIIESRLCAISSDCPSYCGCEIQAETYYQCLLLFEWGCENYVKCTDITCEAELISLSDCEDKLKVDPTCSSCVFDAFFALSPTEDTEVSCLDIQSTVCQSAATCGCGDCTDKVEALFACFTEGCEDFDFACPSDGGSDLAFLWALVAIPLIAVIAVIVYLLMRKKPHDHPVNVKTPINEYSETPPHHGAFEEVGVGSGRINDPPPVSPVSPGSSNEGYVIRTKDQCRTVYGEVPTAMAIIVDDVVPMEPRRDQSKKFRGPDQSKKFMGP